jgi:DNA-binding NtrC family response regulator
MLAEYYIDQFSKRLRSRARNISAEVAEAFRSYEWPGNVRELRNVIERSLILEDGDTITTRYLPRKVTHESIAQKKSGAVPTIRGSGPLPFHLPTGGISLDAVEMSLVRQAITQSEGNQTRAAELLGISRDQLRYRLKKLESDTTESALV